MIVKILLGLLCLILRLVVFLFSHSVYLFYFIDIVDILIVLLFLWIFLWWVGNLIISLLSVLFLVHKFVCLPYTLIPENKNKEKVMSPCNPPYQKKDIFFFFLECYLELIHFLKPPYPLYGFIFRNQGEIVEKVILFVLVIYVLVKKYKKDLHSGIDGSIIILLLLFITYFIIMKRLLLLVAVVCSMVWVVCRAEDKCVWQDNMYAVSLRIIDNQIHQSASGDVDSLRMQLAYKARIISLMRNNKYCIRNVK